jgi:hypothetical protein
MIRARIHILILLFVLIDYGVYSVAVGFRHMSWFYGIGGIYSLAAAGGVAAGKRWCKPLVWSLGVLVVLEWVGYTMVAYRSGPFHPGSIIEFCVALLPGLALTCVVGYCCYVVDVYVVRGRPPSESN